VRPGRHALVADGNLAPWIAPVAAALTAAGADLHVETGRARRGVEDAGRVRRLTASSWSPPGSIAASTIFALGGGVVGDLAGFVAATLYRGVDVVHLPTTLVAMTDSAIGGKTAVDLPAGKNLVGAFHQPRAVLAHLPTLATLPPRERRAGFGELWKYALLDGEALWAAVEALAPWAQTAAAPPPAAAPVIAAAATLKVAAIVSATSARPAASALLLNLGHTVGHAIEAAADWQLLHGEAVGLGLIAAARISHRLGLASADLEPRVTAGLAATGLPTALDPWLRPEVLARVAVDKKRTGGRLAFIACAAPGDCQVVDLPTTAIADLLRP
jgi:3-dehydroquinate synthetase